MSDGYISRAVRQYVAERANGYCEYCRNAAKLVGPFSIDHIQPKSRGGSDHPDNLAFACLICNRNKYNIIEALDSLTNRYVALFNPRQHRWQDHFRWNDNCTLVIGITAIGRASINVLKLNRLEAINLRAILFERGEHPPEDY